MTTSITDARFTSLHFTPSDLIALYIDDDPETGWGVMPGYDQTLPIPLHLEPPRLDADETLPNQMHPSYPFGRGPTRGMLEHGSGRGRGVELLGSLGLSNNAQHGSGSSYRGQWLGGRAGDGWGEMGLSGILEREKAREVPPGMAGAKRPPSPPPPSLHPHLDPLPRSEHLQTLQARQRERHGLTSTYPTGADGGAQTQGTSAPADDIFDAPVPNETYTSPGAQEGQEQQRGQGGTAGQNGGSSRQGASGMSGVRVGRA